MEDTDAARLEHRIVAGSPDAILYADRDGIIRYWNAAAERVFGFPEAEAVGRSLDLIVPERWRERHWRGWAAAVESGVTRYTTETLGVPAMRRDGTMISVEFTIQVLRDDDGRVQGMAATLRDVTSRYRREKALAAKCAEREGTSFSL